MSLTSTDLFIIERGGSKYQMAADQLATFVGAIKDYTATDIAARNAGTTTPAVPASGLQIGDRVFVTDATADADVDSGWAVYRVQSIEPVVYQKVQEQESLDITVTAANLSYIPASGQGTIANSQGNDAIIPLADSTNAGLASPAMFNNQHSPATSALTAAVNPVTVDEVSQTVGFSISQLDPLP